MDSSDTAAAPSEATAAQSEPAPQPAHRVIELPLASWVHGGTTSMAYDNQQAAMHADAERRRNNEAARQQFALQNPAEARLRTLRLTSHQHHPVVVLRCEYPEDLRRETICELTFNFGKIDKDNPAQLTMVCLHCVLRLNRPQDQAQLTIRSQHRGFELDARRAGELYVDHDDNNKAYTLAGTITGHDWWRCDHLGCGVYFRVDNSKIIFR